MDLPSGYSPRGFRVASAGKRYLGFDLPIVVDARPMLKAEDPLHNCTNRVVFHYDDRIRRMPLERQYTTYRGKTIIQADEDAIVRGMTVAVKTDKAVAQLRWTGARVVADVQAHREALKVEVSKYDRLFAAAVERIAEGEEGI